MTTPEFWLGFGAGFVLCAACFLLWAVLVIASREERDMEEHDG